jgi:hypothetical protein
MAQRAGRRASIFNAGSRTGSSGLSSTPLWAAARPAQARDVAVENPPDQYTVFVKNELRFTPCRLQGYANRDPQQLVVESPGGDREILGPVPCGRRATANNRHRVRVHAQEPGQYSRRSRRRPAGRTGDQQQRVVKGS